MKSELAEVTAVVASEAPKAGVWEKNPPAEEEKLEVEVGCPKSDVWVTEAVAGCPKGVVCVKVVDEGWPNKFGCDTVVEGGWPKRVVCATEVEGGWPKGVTWDTVVETGCCPNGVAWGTVVETGCCPKGVWLVEISLEVETSVLGLEKKDGVSDCGCPIIWELDVVGTSDVLEISEEAVETACPNKTVDDTEVWGGSVVNGGEGGLEMDKLDCEVIVSVLVTDETVVVVNDGVVLTTDSISKVASERFTGSDDPSVKNTGCFNSFKSELLTFNSLLASTVLSVFGTFISTLLDKTLELADLFTDFKESTNMFCSWVLGDWVRVETVLLTEFELKLKSSPDRKPEFAKLSSFFVCCSALFDPKKNPVFPVFFIGIVKERFSLSWVLWEGFFSAVIANGADIVVFGTGAMELDDTMIIELELCSSGLSCWIHFEFSGVTLLLMFGLNVDTTVGEVAAEETDQNESLFCPNWKPDAGDEPELLLTVSGLETLDSESFRMLGAKEKGLEKIVDDEETGSEVACLKSGDFISAANENLGNSLLFFTLENRLEPTPWSKF